MTSEAFHTIFHNHAVAIILPVDGCDLLAFNTDLDEVDELRTSAALAAACFGLDDSSGNCGFLPKVLPPFGPLILGGADARAPSV